MIPQADIVAWRRVAPWADDAMVEQDLVLSRAVVEIFSDAALAQAFAFRGGTALHKVVLAPPSRYSEDIDLVQVEAGPIGDVLNRIRARLDPWLGKPTRVRLVSGCWRDLVNGSVICQHGPSAASRNGDAMPRIGSKRSPKRNDRQRGVSRPRAPSSGAR